MWYRIAGFAEECADIDHDTTAALQALARSQHVTLSTIVQGAWSLLLSHYSGSHDVVFGAAFSGRPAEVPGIESLIGPCVNNLPGARDHDARGIIASIGYRSCSSGSSLWHSTSTCRSN